MEKRNIPSEIQLELESSYEREEVVLIDDENSDDKKTDPPAGFEDLLYESDKDEQILNREGIHRTKRKNALDK